MRAKKIQYDDVLRTGTDKLNDAIDVANTAIDTANTAKEVSSESTRQLKSTQAQVDQLVIEGDSSPAAAQAAIDYHGFDHKVLKSRIDSDYASITSRLDQSVPYLNNGVLILPVDFPELPFSIFKNKYGDWKSDATPQNQFDMASAENIFIKHNGSGTNGKNANNPITLAMFRTNFNNGVYGTNKVFILNLLDYIYFLNSNASNGMVYDFDADVYFRPMNANKYTWFGRFKNPLLNSLTSAWAIFNNIYKTTQTANHDVLDVVNLARLDDNNMPKVYLKVTSLAECQRKKGTFFRDGPDCYCNPHDGHEINDVILVVSTGVISINQQRARTAVFENVGFVPSAYNTATGGNVNTSFYYFSCRFHRGVTNGLYKAGSYKVYCFDTIVSHPSLDCFNYHTDDPNSLAVEINCIGYGAGKYKLSLNQPTHSNNGSTAHDGMYMLRVGSAYSECEGPIVADVDNCYSISIDCEASGILDSCTGVRAAYYYYDRPGDTELTSKPKYLLESKGYGENVDIAVKGTKKTYVVNFYGIDSFEGELKGRGGTNW